jgi:REP element-mobilizing transposase RayT
MQGFDSSNPILAKELFMSGNKFRHSLRLKHYDYSKPGAYFITICVKDRKLFLGNVMDNKTQVNEYGEIVQKCWQELKTHFRCIRLDEFVVMPNHVHGIIMIDSQLEEKNTKNAMNQEGSIKQLPTLGQIVRHFKAKTCTLIRKSGFSEFEWQRNYYEHIIRDESELNDVREYIVYNPNKWDEDNENPKVMKIDI